MFQPIDKYILAYTTKIICMKWKNEGIHAVNDDFIYAQLTSKLDVGVSA